MIHTHALLAGFFFAGCACSVTETVKKRDHERAMVVRLNREYGFSRQVARADGRATPFLAFRLRTVVRGLCRGPMRVQLHTPAVYLAGSHKKRYILYCVERERADAHDVCI